MVKRLHNFSNIKNSCCDCHCKCNPLVQAAAVTQTNKATFQRNNVKLYVPVVTLPIHDKIDLLGNIRQGFKRPITWSEYKSEITKLSKKTIISII